jgi:hypothetical protein
MRSLFAKASLWLSPAHTATWLIGGGLAVLLAHTIWHALPVLAAVAMIFWGATNATIGRPLDKAALGRHLILSAFVYASLYVLFVGAVLDAAARTSPGRLAPLQVLDLVLSVVLIVVAVRTAVLAIVGKETTTDR